MPARKQRHKRSRVQASDQFSIILAKLDSIERKIQKTERVEQQIEREEQKLEQTEASIRREDLKIEKEEAKIEKTEEKLEHAIIRLGNFTIKKRHLMELIRGVAGAFLGVGLGIGLLNMQDLGSTLPWKNVIGILIFILFISTLLIYKNNREFIRKEGAGLIWRRLITLYLIAIAVEFIAIGLFGGWMTDPGTLLKTVIIGSYSAMAGAVSFSIL